MTAANTDRAAAASVVAAAPDPDEAQRAIEYCYERGWSDGLPLVPVSQPLLEAFLATTAHPVAVLTEDKVKERAAQVLDDVVALLIDDTKAEA